MALLRLPLFLLLLHLLISAVFIAESSPFDADWGLSHLTSGTRGAGSLITAPSSTCNGLVGECMNLEDEFAVDSDVDDVVRRALAGGYRRRFISYGALKRNQVPCNRRGHSYYGCGRASRANPYRRGCTAITRCKRNVG